MSLYLSLDRHTLGTILVYPIHFTLCVWTVGGKTLYLEYLEQTHTHRKDPHVSENSETISGPSCCEASVLPHLHFIGCKTVTQSGQDTNHQDSIPIHCSPFHSYILNIYQGALICIRTCNDYAIFHRVHHLIVYLFVNITKLISGISVSQKHFSLSLIWAQ